jgi:O-antigen/teichoic acid export membrane protein
VSPKITPEQARGGAKSAVMADALATDVGPVVARDGAPWSRGAARGLFGDIARFGTATILAAVFGAVQVFLIPRRLDVTTYGQYRLFLLYVGYLGVLHFGLADGAFVRWAGQPRSRIAAEWRRVVRWVVLAGLAIVGLTSAVSLVADPVVQRYLVALAACALGMNATTLAGYALQASGDFTRASRVAVLAPGLFVATVALVPMRSLPIVLGAYVAAYAIAALVGSTLVARTPRDSGDGSVALIGLLKSGLPVLGANLAAGVSQFADRILVSMSVPITSFAMYGFASSVMVGASAASHALSRVALSHAAWRSGDARAKFLLRFYDLIAAGFGVIALGVPLFERLVTHWLPAYLPALPIVRALAIGAPFWVAMHVVVVGTLQSYGMVRRQLAVELVGLALVSIACGIGLRLGVPLWGIAAIATTAAAVTWSLGAALVGRLIPAARDAASQRFLVTIGSQAVALMVASAITASWPARTIIYAALAAFPTWLALRAVREHWRR